MKPFHIRLLSAFAAVGLLVAAAPAHASDTQPDESAPIIVKPDPADRIIPPQRPPRIAPCPVRPAPPGWQVPLYCDIIPIPWPIYPGPGVPVDR